MARRTEWIWVSGLAMMTAGAVWVALLVPAIA